MFVTMVIAALVVDAIFGAAGLIPHARPTRADIFSSVKLDYKLVLNILGLLVFATLVGLTLRKGAKDPVCGMTVDRLKAVKADHDGRTYYFCSEQCRRALETEPERRTGEHMHHAAGS